VRPAFASNSIAATIFAITLLVWTAIEVRQGLQRRAGATNTDRGSLMAVRVAAIAGALLAASVARIGATSFVYGPALIVLSIALMWAGIALRWWSFRTLGRYFTFQVMTSADQPVITTGPYRYLRHPSYTGILLILAGVGLGYGNVLSLAALIVLPLLGFINRIRVEEAALSATLGDRYTTYAMGRKRLVPFVW
jgi:protein-S-isoprenylcysteine O-methyltransferase Ste14